jgi:cytochrome c oxidase assembly factor CtaG
VIAALGSPVVVSMQGAMALGGATGVMRMAFMGVTVSVMAPAVVLAVGDRLPGFLSRLPAPVTLAAFVVLHDTIMVTGPYVSPQVHLLFWLAVFAGAMVFWLPVVGPHRISDAGRLVYLFVACPALDMSAVAMIGMTGDEAGGLAMILGMLPIGAVELVLFWRWAMREERLAEAAPTGGMPAGPVTGS